MHKALENFQQHTTDFLDALALFPERSRTIAPEGEWSAAYIVHHLSDGETNFAGRFLLTLGADNPHLVLFNEEWYPEFFIMKNVPSINHWQRLLVFAPCF